MNLRYIVFVAFVVSIGGFLFGFDAAVISGVNGFIIEEFGLSNLQLGWVNSSVTFSSALAMLLSGALSDRFGRKKILLAIAFLYTLSALASALAPSYQALVTARLVRGFAFGAALVLVPTYIAELAPTKIRGSLVSINQLAIVLGFSAAYFSNYFWLNASTSESTFAQTYNLSTEVLEMDVRD